MFRQVFLLLGVLVLVSCGSGDNSRVTVKLQNNLAKNSILDWVLPSAYGTVDNVKFCFKRLRFKRVDDEDDSDEDNDSGDADANFDLGLVEITPNGKTLGVTDVPRGEYRRIDMFLKPDCGNFSVQVKNDFGTFETKNPIMIMFDGHFEADEAEEVLTIVIDDLLELLDDIQSDGDIRDSIRIRKSF